jgi:hypothetical protein
MTLEDIATQMYHALQGLPCRCQMKGGPKWHCLARTEVVKQCSRCAAMEEYEKFEENKDG